MKAPFRCGVGEAWLLTYSLRQPNKLGTAQKKIFKIDSHMGIVISGLTADARALAKYMRTECLNHRYYYNSAMITGRLVSDIADKSQNKTLASWKRPYGVGLLVAGVDKDGPHLYQTCPSGNLFEVNGMAIGDKSHNARTYLVQNAASFASASKDELIIHALSALKDRTSAGEDEDGNPDLSAATACVAFVGVGESFTVLENETIQPYLDRMPN